MIKEITSDELVNLSNNCVVLVYASMCGTCEQAKVMLNVVSEILPNPFYQININLYPSLIETYHVTSVPAFLVYKEGVVIETFYAFHSVPHLYIKFKELIT